jgi:Mn-dependent DtxR family transcriptional regulator
MNTVNQKNYPPEGLFNILKNDYEHLTLWMLSNNDECKWSDFTEEPLNFSTSTVSKYINRLQDRGQILKISRGVYRITPEGFRRFNEISSSHGKEKKLNYPPKIILRKRSYADWILWMVYNNNYCKWSDFAEPPLSINRHSLSKKMNLLKEQEFISHENKEYRITHSGKLQYSKMLEKYDLDRQSILNEESKRIEDLTNKTLTFFEHINLEDEEIQYRFLVNSLKLDYSRVSSMLTEQNDFEKILLFLSINHPDYFPNFITLNEFSKKYEIEGNKLSYFIDEIVENQIYPIKFFKLTLPNGNPYYFQENETLEVMLRAITEKFIKKSTYLSQLKARVIQLEKIEQNILNETCSKVFNPNIRDALKEFLPEYMNYLAYKMEVKVELRETYDKLEAIIWQNMMDALQTRDVEIEHASLEESIQDIDQLIKSDPFNIELYLSKCAILKYYNKYDELLDLLDEMLQSFPDLEVDLSMKKADVFKLKGDIRSGYEIIKNLSHNYPDQIELQMYEAYWLMYLNKKDQSLNQMKKVLNRESNNGVFYDTYGEIFMNYKEYESAIEQFQKAIKISDQEWFIYQTYIKLGICYKQLENYKLASENLRKGRDYTENSSADQDTKQKWITIAELFLTDIENTME